MTGAENPPDGVETVYEWREGNHKCIERRAGPGEDVSAAHPTSLASLARN